MLSVEVNSGDDDGVPTARHNEARMLICEEQGCRAMEAAWLRVRDQELPELQESLLHQAGCVGRRFGFGKLLSTFRDCRSDDRRARQPGRKSLPDLPGPSAS